MKGSSIVFALLLSLVFVFTGCQSDVAEMKSARKLRLLTQRTWQIPYYGTTAIDTTEKYHEFDFTFYTDGVLLARSEEAIFSGTWSLKDEREGEGDILSLNVNSPAGMTELNREWHVTFLSRNAMEIKHYHSENDFEVVWLYEKSPTYWPLLSSVN